ncbi:MAG: ubiquinone-dependent pyruvate dehydrogenase [Snodgrassella sp.]|uniref:thiamine pyrophosphate-dependent enzyme n=1 Tax=Snodgrassella TaxID=1193515 RepID=UPI0008158F30|nr:MULTISPECIES: thiamine pyrophosphate-dependent enzyme [Snodgrassella]MCO6506774.1 ubiquinone-dependent pyruvate dehydrogenase [Snodgrassella sp.]MCO6507652.1 ubiquinone-dependent pyruvate dehydrogenase [Snodgrassella sp.]MCO6513898.1 ubiquinone-dependent pyruvate dehydrogenase [Snodgrassella sp.]SCB88102.1 pyruvate dehydrogenase (quinone) [Snodgrassella sp. R-53583]
MSKTKTVSEVLIDVLTTAGVSNCYGIIGDTLNFVGKAIEKSSINWVHTRHEEAAAFAAGAEAMITNKLTACAGSCGPGSLHLINGLYESNRNNAPVIVIASQLAATSMGTGFPQEVDFLKVYQDTSVFCQMVTQPQEAQRIFTQAAQAAINKRGVAVVILPSDISKMEVVEQPIKIWHPQPVTRPNDSEIEELVKTINQGNRITIYAGYGSKDAHDEVIALAEKLKAPVVHTSRAKDSIAWENPYQVGMTGMFGTKAGYEAVKNCDTLLLLGCSFAWTEFYPENANIIQIDHDATQLGLRHPINLGLVGDIKTTLQTVLPKIQPRSDSSFLDHHTALFTKIMDKYEAHATPDDKHPIHPQQLIELIDKHADDNALITADVGTPMLWGSRYLTMNGKRRFLTSLKHGTMANGMPQAYGLQKAFPARQVISLSGDGGLAMLMGDLLTAKQENLPIKIVVFNNSSLNFVEQEQKGEGLVEVFVDLKNGDFKTIAEGCGFSAQSVSKSSELETAVQTFLAHKGPALLDVVISDKELIMPPAISYENVKNMVWYGSKAILEGKGKDVIDMIKNNI